MQTLTCRQFIEFLDDFLADIQPEETRLAFQRHLSVCRQCGDYVRTYRETIKLGKAAFKELDQHVPEHVPEELVRAVLALTTRRDERSPDSSRPSF
jgi:hypothetical protein